MCRPILTIIIPTYNRAKNLTILLKTIDWELSGTDDMVRIIIGDNNSGDETDQVIRAFTESHPKTVVVKHKSNVGADENFCRCIELVSTRFFWIIGDDDRPLTGSLKNIVGILNDQLPDILYINSKWDKKIQPPLTQEVNVAIIAQRYNRENFSKKINIWVSYISGVIINVERLYFLNSGINIRRFHGSFLVQLGWVLPLLMTGNRFYIIKRRCILATTNNSGGYKLLEVFGCNFPSILSNFCGLKTPEFKAIYRPLVWGFLPGLVWAARSNKNANFIKENILGSIKNLQSSASYLIILRPLIELPYILALLLFTIYRIIRKIISYYNKLK